MEHESAPPLCPPDPTTISYTLIRAVGLALDELSSQGLHLWQDAQGRWRWAGVALQAERGYWAIGEAMIDAVVTRFPAAFETSPRAELE